MAGMMIAMTLGMTIGLSFGTSMGLIYPEHFFQMTVISILVGAIAGTIAGLSFNMIAVLDGFLSGAMGGMMGAMLGVMISSEFVNNAMNVIIVITGGIIFILFLMIQNEVKITKRTLGNSIFRRRFPLFFIILLAFYATHQYSIPMIEEESDHSHHHQDQ